MSKKDAVVIASRVLALYFFCWFLSDVTYLPSHLLAVLHYASFRNLSPTESYFYSYDRVGLGFLYVRILGLLFASWLFYRCGPRVQRFLLNSSDVAA